MRVRLVVAAVFALIATAVLAQEHDPVPVLAPSKINADRLRWMQYKMVAGRVAASSSYPGTNMTFGPAEVEGRRRERLEIRITPAQIHLRYELTSASERLAISLADGQVFSIRRDSSEPKYSLLFEQSPGQSLRLSLAQADSEAVLLGDSFWHLYLAEPELVRRHLIPLLEILHPSWQLASMGSAIEEALVERAQNHRPNASQLWGKWVDELASPSFSDRASAERALTSAGQAVLPFLQHLDRSRLDAEQASRVRALVDSLSVDYEDSADRIATWLAGDEAVWLSLLTRGEPLRRRVAAAQLSLVVGTPIDFDPQADEATRKTQIERLRARLRKTPPPGRPALRSE